jgi:hypothetical protein
MRSFSEIYAFTRCYERLFFGDGKRDIMQLMRMDEFDQELNEFIGEWARACGLRSGQVGLTSSWMPWSGPYLSSPILKRQSTSHAQGEALAMAVLKAILYDKKAINMFVALMEDKEQENKENHRIVFVLFPNWLEAIELLTAIKRNNDTMSKETLTTLYAYTMLLDSRSAHELIKDDKRAGRLKSFDPDAPRTATGAATRVFQVGVVADQTNICRWEKAVAAFTAVNNSEGDKDSFALMNLLSEARGNMDTVELCESLGMTIDEAWITYSDTMDHRTVCSAGGKCVNACQGLPQPKRLLRCSKCLMSKYCGEECQNLNWKKHKHRCPLLGIIRNGIKKNLMSPEFKAMQEKIKALDLEERSDPSLELMALNLRRKAIASQATKSNSSRSRMSTTMQVGMLLVVASVIFLILKLF